MASNILINLSEYLKDTDIFKVLLPIIDEYIRYTFKTKKELRQAVYTWCNDEDIAIKTYDHIKIWNTQFITDMSHLFQKKKQFNDDISNWDTGCVTNMRSMFNEAESFNQPLNFDTSSVINMHSMFYYAYEFNQPLNFDTSSVTNITDIDDMFNKCPISEENKPKLKIDN